MILTVTANPAIDKVYFVDTFTMGEVHRPIKMTATAGGKGLNVARVATILGESVTVMGFVGGGAGRFICEQIADHGITSAFTQINGETRTCINISDKDGRSGEILEAGPAIAPEEVEAFQQQFDAQIGQSDIICVSGSLPKGVDSSFYRKLIKGAKGQSKKIIVDTSGKTMTDILDAGPYMIKPNRDELETLLGYAAKDESDLKKALLLLKEKGVSVPLVTLGKEGAISYIDGQFYRFSSPEVTVKNAVGSGDSTVAGIAVGLCRGLSVVDAIRLGMAAGAANTQFAQTGVVSPELVQQYYAEINVVSGE